MILYSYVIKRTHYKHKHLVNIINIGRKRHFQEFIGQVTMHLIPLLVIHPILHQPLSSEVVDPVCHTSVRLIYLWLTLLEHVLPSNRKTTPKVTVFCHVGKKWVERSKWSPWSKG